MPMSIRDLLRILRRNLIVVLACLLGGAVAGGLPALNRPSSYTTLTRLFVSSNVSDSSDTLLQNSNLVLDRVPSYVTLVNSPFVLNQVAQRLGGSETVDSMSGRVAATSPLQTALIEITVRDTTARRAYDLALAVAAVVTSVVPRLETSATGFAPIKITMVSQPGLPSRPDLAPVGVPLAVGLLLGLLLGVAVAVCRELLDGRLDDPEQLRTRLGLAPLAVLTATTGKHPAPTPLDDVYWSSPASEGYRQLRANLRVAVAAGELRSILVTGPHAEDDAPTVARNLAIALGLAKVRVLLIDADLRHPRPTAAFGIGPDDPSGDDEASDTDEPSGAAEPSDNEDPSNAGTGGLAAALSGAADIDAVIRPWRDGTIHVLPAGRDAGSAELLASAAMDDLLAKLEGRFDLLIISAPSVLEVADAAALATRVDGVVLTVRCRRTRWNAVSRAVQALYDVQARMLGAAVLCRSRSRAVGSPDARPVQASTAARRGAAVVIPGPRTYDAARRGAVSARQLRRPQRRLPVPPQSPAPAPHPPPRQVAPARGVAAVNGALDAVQNYRSADPNQKGKW